MSRLFRRLQVAYFGQVEPTEISLSVITLLWGLWMANPLSHATSTIKLVYWFLPSLFDQAFVGTIAIVLGIAALVAFALSRTKSRKYIMLGIFVLWLYITVSLALTEPYLPTNAFVSITVVQAAWAFFRLGSAA